LIQFPCWFDLTIGGDLAKFGQRQLNRAGRQLVQDFLLGNGKSSFWIAYLFLKVIRQFGDDCFQG
jgi:hypothetical protein